MALGEPSIDDVQLAQARQLPSNAADEVSSIAAFPLVQDRNLVDGCATAYVCRDFACLAPVMEPKALSRLLENGGIGTGW